MCLSLQLVCCFSVRKKIQLFLKQHGAGNQNLAKEEIVVTDSFLFAAIL